MVQKKHPEDAAGTATTPEGEPTRPTRWHPCTICPSPEGSYYTWPYVCCQDCHPGLEEALCRAYEDYRARRRQEMDGVR